MTKLYDVYYADEDIAFWPYALLGNVTPEQLPCYTSRYYRCVGEISADHMDMAYLLLQRDAYEDITKFPFPEERSMSVGDLFVDVTPSIHRRFMSDDYYMVDKAG